MSTAGLQDIIENMPSANSIIFGFLLRKRRKNEAENRNITKNQ